MATALDLIVEYKKDEVGILKKNTDETFLLQRAKDAPVPRGFAAALSAKVAAGQNGLICELKRKSPSAGEILPGADPVEIATEYERGGAACLSILTDGPSFGGSLEDFDAIRAAVNLPLLRKDFVIDPLQIIEARAHGADCVLLILSVLDDVQCRDFLSVAQGLGMDALIETHDAHELERALKLEGGLIGINNRDLKRMVTDLATTECLSGLLPDGTHYVSESGVASPDDIQRLRRAGAFRFLIGESLMKRSDRSSFIGELLTAGTD